MNTNVFPAHVHQHQTCPHRVCCRTPNTCHSWSKVYRWIQPPPLGLCHTSTSKLRMKAAPAASNRQAHFLEPPKVATPPTTGFRIIGYKVTTQPTNATTQLMQCRFLIQPHRTIMQPRRAPARVTPSQPACRPPHTPLTPPEGRTSSRRVSTGVASGRQQRNPLPPRGFSARAQGSAHALGIQHKGLAFTQPGA